MTKLHSLGVAIGDELGQIKFLRLRDAAALPDEADADDATSPNPTNKHHAPQEPLKTVYTLNARLAVHDILVSNLQAKPLTTSSPLELLAARGWKKGGEGIVNELQYTPRSSSIQDKEHVLEGLRSPMKFFKVGTSPGESIFAAYDVEGNISSIPRWSSVSTVNTFAVKGPISTAVGVTNSSNFAFGGRENDLNVHDFSTQQEVFKARNVPHDMLDMQVPVWITGIAPMPSSEAVFATCTGYAQVRVYDIRAQRRPVKDLRLPDWSHMTGVVSVDDDKVVISDTQGHVSKLNLQTMRLEAKYKGFAGGVRSLDVHPDAPFLLAGGLDRRVHVHHLNTRKVFADVYVKQKLNVVMFCPQLDLREGDKVNQKRTLDGNISGQAAKKPKDMGSGSELDSDDEVDMNEDVGAGSDLGSDDEVDSLEYTSSSEEDDPDGFDSGSNDGLEGL